MLRSHRQRGRRALFGEHRIGPSKDFLKRRPVRPTDTPLPHLLMAPGDPGIGLACIVDMETEGVNPEADRILRLSILRFAFQRMTGKLVGILEQYVGRADDPTPIDYRYVDYLMLRSELIVAHDGAVARDLLVGLVPSAAIRPWRDARTGVDWVVNDGDDSLSGLMTSHHIKVANAPDGLERVYGFLALLTHTNERGRAYLFPLVV